MKKIIFILLLVISMGTMYYFSSQDGKTSSEQSNKVVRVIDEIRAEVTLKNEKLIMVKDKIFNKLRGYGKSYLVRKLAHFSIYAVIGVCMMLVIYAFSKKIILSATFGLLLSMLYAMYDENRQLYVDGRSGSLKDVLIDSSGALTGIIIMVLLLSTGRGILHIFSGKDKRD